MSAPWLPELSGGTEVKGSPLWVLNVEPKLQASKRDNSLLRLQKTHFLNCKTYKLLLGEVVSYLTNTFWRKSLPCGDSQS